MKRRYILDITQESEISSALAKVQDDDFRRFAYILPVV